MFLFADPRVGWIYFPHTWAYSLSVSPNYPLPLFLALHTLFQLFPFTSSLDLYENFVIEERHGFNKPLGFYFADKVSLYTTTSK